MRRFLGKAVAVGLGLASVHVQAQSTSTDCSKTPSDISWMGKAVSAQPTANGHVVAMLDAGGVIRLNEWLTASKTWRGWTVMPYMSESSAKKSVWVQPIVNPNSQHVAQNVFATDGTNLISQWICNAPDYGSNGNDWKCYKAKRMIPSSDQGNTIDGHVASGQIDNSTQWGGRQLLVAKFNDGSLRSMTWTPDGLLTGNWKGDNIGNWNRLGVYNIQSSPYILQIATNKIMIFARSNNGIVMSNVVTDGNFGTWNQLPSTPPDPNAPATLVGELSAALNPATNTIFIYSMGSNKFLQYQTSTNGGTSWSGWKYAAYFSSDYQSITSAVNGSTPFLYMLDPQKSNGIKVWTEWNKALVPSKFVNCVTTTVVPGP